MSSNLEQRRRADEIERLAQTRYDCALWYAWGQIDAGVGAGVLGIHDGFTFAEEQRDAVRAGTQSHSILNEWDDYLARKGVQRY